MRPSSDFPGSRFRLATLAVLAAMTVGGAALGLGPSANVATDGALAVTSAPGATGGDVAGDPLGGGESVTEVTTTLVGRDDQLVDAQATHDDGPLAETAVVGVGGADGLAVVGTAGVSVAGDGGVGVDPLATETAAAESVAAEVGGGADAACATPTADPGATVVTDTADASPMTSGIADPMGDAPAAPTTEAASTTDAPPVSGGPSALVRDGFDAGDAAWTPLSGTWSIVDGRYVQSDATGYDFLSQFAADLPTEFAISIELTALDGPLGGGVMLGQPVIGSRRGATLVDFTDGGMFLRWGTYDGDTGQYAYAGGVALGADFEPQATHTLTVEVRSGRTMVVVDGRSVGEFAPISPGRVGLSSSLSAVAFDDVQIVSL